MKLYPEIMRRFAAEPADERELRGLENLDAGDFAVYSARLELIAQEAKTIMTTTAISEPIQSGDCSFGIYTAQGDLAIAAPGTYVHSITGQISIKFIRKYYLDDPSVGVRPGDIFFANEPQLGGLHTPDLQILMPVFHEGQLVCWVVTIGHNQEIGETDPGGQEHIRSRYDEGLKSPPLKIAENHELKSDMVAMFCNMVRNHRMFESDLRVRCAACVRGEERLLALFGEAGADRIAGVMRRMIDATDKAVRRVFGELLDGVYRQVLFLDAPGNNEDGLLRIMITVHVHGDTITVDLNGCSPQVPAAGNCPTHLVRAAINAQLPAYVVPGVPCSSGLLNAIEIIAPPAGTVLNPFPDAAVMLSANLLAAAAQAFMQCIIRAGYPTRHEYMALPIGWIGTLYAYAGLDQYQRMTTGFANNMYNSAAGGACSVGDGIDSMGVLVGITADSLDIEHDEIQHPFIYAFRRLAHDQAGAGKYRGGAGGASGVYVHDSASLYGQIISLPHSFPINTGIFGGYAANCTPAIRVRNEGVLPFADPGIELPTRIQQMIEPGHGAASFEMANILPFKPMTEGDGFPSCGPGGGGWGDVLERDPEAVMQDLRTGVYSHWTARKVFCVAYDERTLIVDEAGTERLRAEERHMRLGRGKPCAEFLTEWEKLSLPAELLRTYGSWPDAKPAAGNAFFA